MPVQIFDMSCMECCGGEQSSSSSSSHSSLSQSSISMSGDQACVGCCMPGMGMPQHAFVTINWFGEPPGPRNQGNVPCVCGDDPSPTCEPTLCSQYNQTIAMCFNGDLDGRACCQWSGRTTAVSGPAVPTCGGNPNPNSCFIDASLLLCKGDATHCQWSLLFNGLPLAFNEIVYQFLTVSSPSNCWDTITLPLLGVFGPQFGYLCDYSHPPATIDVSFV